jgi:fucose 4-O-acetylase-like acetyltransferase
MKQKLLSILLLLAGLVIGLGGIGHSFGGVGQVKVALANQSFPPDLARLILVVWHFAGGCMVVLGLFVVWQWRELHRGRRAQPFVLYAIGLFYLAYGISAVLYTSAAFFSVFIVLGVGVLLCTSLLPKNTG